CICTLTQTFNPTLTFPTSHTKNPRFTPSTDPTRTCHRPDPTHTCHRPNLLPTRPNPHLPPTQPAPATDPTQPTLATDPTNTTPATFYSPTQFTVFPASIKICKAKNKTKNKCRLRSVPVRGRFTARRRAFIGAIVNGVNRGGGGGRYRKRSKKSDFLPSPPCPSPFLPLTFLSLSPSSPLHLPLPLTFLSPFTFLSPSPPFHLPLHHTLASLSTTPSSPIFPTPPLLSTPTLPHLILKSDVIDTIITICRSAASPQRSLTCQQRGFCLDSPNERCHRTVMSLGGRDWGWGLDWSVCLHLLN
ncbi:hypothetical protein Pcinc_031883, partial [Petrolisthes cinctipes]